MFKNAQRRGLINRLMARGLDPFAATAISAAAYPGAGFDPPKRPVLSKAALIDSIEAFLSGALTAETLFERAFGLSEAEVLGYATEGPAQPPSPRPNTERDEIVYEGDMALYGGQCQSCGSTDRALYPGWKMMGMGLWACKECIRQRSGDNTAVLDLVSKYEAGEIDIVVAQDTEWARLTDLHAQ